jgi:hypothetical protein
LLGFVLLTALGGLLHVSVVIAARTGRVNAAGRPVERAKRPGQFVLNLVVQLAFAATALTLLVGILADRLMLGPKCQYRKLAD